MGIPRCSARNSIRPEFISTISPLNIKEGRSKMSNRKTVTVKEDGWTEERDLISEGVIYDVFEIWNSDMGPKPNMVQSLLNKFLGRKSRMMVALNKNGDPIGDVTEAESLCDKRGIVPEMADPEHSVCTIGFCERDNKWYGWSHRAIAGFGIGDKIYEENFKGDFPDDAVFPQDHGTVDVKNLDDARLAAIRYAECVS